MSLLNWSLAIAAAIHISEEFAFPGGFKTWYLTYKPEIARSVSNRFLVFINTVLMVFSITVALAMYFPNGNGVAAWLTLAALLFSNAIFHIVGAVRTRQYSPGMISGIVLYIPLAIYGFLHFVRSGQASIGTAFFALLIGGSYHFIAYLNHRRRASSVSTEAAA